MPPPFPNPPASVASLLATVTKDTVNTIIINGCIALGLRADLWPQEDALRSCMYAVAAAISGFVQDRVDATKAGWLPTATRAWLTWLALYMYGVVRTPATFAGGPLTLSNAGGGVYSFAPRQARFQNTVTGAFYTNTTAIALAAGPGTTQTISIEATVLGTGGNAAPGQITTMTTTMLGVTCTNLAAVLGIDEQSDAALQLECWNSIAANSAYGPAQSFGYAVQNATNAITGTPVNINRWTISPSSHTGQVVVTVASPEGAPDPNDVTGVANNIAAIARPPNVQVTTQGAINLFVTDAITLYVTATPGLDAASVQTAAETALDTFFQAYPISGQAGPGGAKGIFATGIEGACFGAWPGVFAVTGAIDHPMTLGQVAINATTVSAVLV